MAGLTLLECDVPRTDAQIRKGAESARKAAEICTTTYDLAVAILFLDRLGEASDRVLIQKLAYRLLGSQKPMGGWDYNCEVLQQTQQDELANLLNMKEPAIQNASDRIKNMPVWNYKPGQDLSNAPRPGWEDNSLTQFAILALWKVRRHGVNPDRALAMAEGRFRSLQNATTGTWGYADAGRGQANTRLHSMTCAGLLGLAVGRGVSTAKVTEKGKSLAEDPAVKKAMAYLADNLVGRPALRTAPGSGASSILKADAWGDLYCMWSLERVAMIFNTRKIGDKEWYPWGVEVLLPTQNADGQWSESFPGVVDTSFALLFLKRVNLAKDLTSKLQLGQ
jgi:hypothetical protein